MILLKLYSDCLILSLLILLRFSQPVLGSQGIFEIHIKQYFLDQSLNLERCCSKSEGPSGNCASQCQIFMEICLSIYQKVPHRYACDIGENMIVTDILGSGNLSAVGNRDYAIRVRERWMKNFNILVRIKHRDEKTKKEDVIVTLSSAEENVKPSSDWITKHLSNPKDHFQLFVSFRYSCSKDHYGDMCDKYCKPSTSDAGHYNCSSTGDKICHNGYSGSYCDKVDCQNKCHHGTCIGPNMCRCFTGWSEVSCDKCIPYPGCINGGCRRDEKSNELLPLTCDCTKGWGGMFCNIDLNYCSNNPNVCLNDGECQNFGNINTNQQYRCFCKPGFKGTHCEKFVANCAVRGCLNDGQCQTTERGNTSKCICKESFYGDRCDFNMTSCAEAPCVGSNSRCFPDAKLGFKCECATGFMGRNCEIDKDECSTNPCLNGGMCIDRASGFRCVCPVGFSGDHCQVNKNDCQRLSCMNGAKCTDKANSIDCECTTGWTGTMCNHNINECATNQPCLNGGQCEDSPGSYKCNCPSLWTGIHCETKLLQNRTVAGDRKCAINPCRNHGICFLSSKNEKVDNQMDELWRSIGGPYYCLCPPGFSGRLCKQVMILNGSTIDANEDSLSTPFIIFTDKSTKHSMTLINLIIIAIGVPAILIILLVISFVWCKTSTKFGKSHNNSTVKNDNFANNANIKIVNNKLNPDQKSLFNCDKMPLSIKRLNNEITNQEMNNCLHKMSPAHLPLYTYKCSMISRPGDTHSRLEHGSAMAQNHKLFSLKSMNINEEDDQFIEKSVLSANDRDGEPESIYQNHSHYNEFRKPNLNLSLDSNINGNLEPSCKGNFGSNSAMIKRKRNHCMRQGMCSSQNSLLDAPPDRTLRDALDD